MRKSVNEVTIRGSTDEAAERGPTDKAALRKSMDASGTRKSMDASDTRKSMDALRLRKSIDRAALLKSMNASEVRRSVIDKANASIRSSITSHSDTPAPTHLSIKDIRITPPSMVFQDAYDGKQFIKKLIIQNCGTHSTFVRLLEPNSKTFKFKPFPTGFHISPGIKIVRTVKYTFSRAFEVLQGFTTIWVDDIEVKYDFTVVLSASVVSVEPQIIDFGRVDAVNHAISRTFCIKNTGCKGCNFAIDLGTNPLGITVDPLKGSLPAQSSVPIKVEIVGTTECEFTEEFWIKTRPPQRVIVTGSFISPKLLVRRFINSLDFTLLDFPPTYYGSTSTQTILMRNFSSFHSMFCIRAEIKGTTMTLDEARQIDSNFKNYVIKPLDGRMAALKGILIEITFVPVETAPVKKYAACFLKVIRMNCRDTDSEEIKEFLHTQRLRSLSTASAYNMPSLSNYTIVDANTTSVVSLNLDEIGLPEENTNFEHAIGVCLHGLKERAGIDLRPTMFILNDLTLDKVYNRELLVTNKSSILPVRVRYNKVASISVQPPEFDLNSGRSLEVLVSIRGSKLDHFEETITFDLLAQSTDSIKNKNYFQKVGTASMDVVCDTTKVEKKPRLKQCVVCKDVVPKLDPEFKFKFSPEELEKKMQNDEYYLNYIRSLQKPPHLKNENLKEYQTSVKQRSKSCCFKLKPHVKKEKSITPLIPLAPRLLYNIKITPKAIRLQKVTAYTTITDFLEIENLNDFKINVFLKASKESLVFDNNSRYIIKKREKRRLYFSFSTSQIGRYYINISILINTSTLYEVTAVANVVPKTLKLETSRIEFTEGDGHYKFFKLINALNAYTSFDWDIPEGCFKIYPPDGGIKAESSIFCMVTYTPDPAQHHTAECVLTSESGQKRILTVVLKRRYHLVVFDNYHIDVGLIPLNTTIRKKVTLQNLKNFKVMYSVLNGSYIPGITVEPQEGLVRGLDSQLFIITINFKSVIEFNTEIIFNIDEEEEYGIGLTGTVEYPYFSFVPDTLQFRQISPNSYDTLAVKITNMSACEARLSFPFEDFPEFTITEFEKERYDHQENMVFAPNQSRIIYLHFLPNYVSTYSLYLPYVINDILGPVTINNNQSSFPYYFFQEYDLTYEKIEHITVKKMSHVLPTIRINCRAIDKSLEFSSLVLKMFYYGQDHPSNKTSHDFEVTNTSSEAVEICIRTDDLDFPFFLDPKDGVEVVFYEVSYRIKIEAGAKIAFEAKFLPDDVGVYEVRLPIFLRHYFNNKIFNFLILKGVYGLPSIVASTYCYNFEPIPLGTTNEGSLDLHMTNHFQNCDLLVQSNLSELKVNFEKVVNSNVDFTVHVTLSFEPIFSNSFNTSVTFHCTCNSTCSIQITGVGETCILSTHAFCQHMKEGIVFENKNSKNVEIFGDTPTYGHLLTNKNTTCFPLFPADDDNSWYGKYMRNLKQAVENWLFSQGFYKKNYYKIPDGFSDFSKVKDPMKKMVFGGIKKPKLVDLPLLELIMNIAGSRIRSRMGPSCPKEQDEMEWLRYTCIVNSNILTYLRNFAIFLPHVKSKFLLNFDQYLKYEKIKHPDVEPMEESIFYRRSKQCWLDLILQIIKVFFFFRTVPAMIFEQVRPKSKKIQQQRCSISEIARSMEDIQYETMVQGNVYGPHEKQLITWLKNCYEQELTKLWPEKPPKNKDWIFVDEDLRDGIVLGAVTAHFCSYVKADIQQMYSYPYNPEELHHNICLLVTTWTRLGFSYILSPLAFESGGMAEMFLLLNYLYDVLPHHAPKEKIVIKAPLTQTNHAAVQLENLGDYPIFYKVIFFNNENNLFRVAHDTVTIDAQSSKLVKVHFHAKTVKTAVTTVLFSGETLGHKYAKSVAVNFVGVADVSYSYMTIPLTVDLYKICHVVLQVEAPFKEKTEYSLSFNYQQASKEKNLLFPMDEIKRLKTPKEFYLPDETYEFDEDGKCSMKLIFCCQQQGPRDLWFYFTNPEVGDWGIQVTLTGRVAQACYENINVHLPHNYKHLVCRCKHRPSLTANCPVILHIRLPKLNNLLWDARKAMVLHNVEGQELKFWKNRIYTPTGTRILKLLFNSETHPLRKVIEDSMEFDVSLDKPRAFITMRKVVIDDIIADEDHMLPIHPIQDLTTVESCTMKLVSVKGSETRYYKVFFNKSKEESELEDSENSEVFVQTQDLENT